MAAPWQWWTCREIKRRCPMGGTAFRGWPGRRMGKKYRCTATRTGGDRSLYASDLAGKVRLLARVPGELTILDVGKDGSVLLTRGNDRAGIIGLAPGETKEKDLSWLGSVGAGKLVEGWEKNFISRGRGRQQAEIRGVSAGHRWVAGDPVGRRQRTLVVAPMGSRALARLNVMPVPLLLYPTAWRDQTIEKRRTQSHLRRLPAGWEEVRFHRNGTRDVASPLLESLDDPKAKTLSIEGVGSAMALSPDGAIRRNSRPRPEGLSLPGRGRGSETRSGLANQEK